MRRAVIVIAAAALALAGCSKDNKPSAAATPSAKASAPAVAAGGQPPAGGGAATPAKVAGAAHAAAPAAPAAAAAAGSGAGKVLETMSSGGYTYVKVAGAAGEVWAAGPEVAVKVGDEVSFSGGAPMARYHSKTLDRTFDMVYFVPAIRVGGKPPAVATAHGDPLAAPAGGSGGPHGVPAAVAEPIKGIAKAKGGHTVAEVFAGKATLSGKQVAVRGKVVKYNAGIMGRNWLHLQDGSGAAGTNDLTVTTNDTVAVGDVVLVRGTVVTGKDFGAGYKYDVLLENATVSK